jgi:cytoskeleton protein RodZ
MHESADNSASASPAEPAAVPAAVPVPTPVARTIGERLRAGRERAGLSVPAAAEKLHLDTKVIEALEGDRFAEIGASVYVRGHLKRYGDFVGEAGVELVNMYNTREARPAPPDLTQVPHPERRADPRRLVTPAVMVACAGVLMAATWWVLSGSRSVTAPAADQRPTLVVPDDAAPMVSANLPTGISATPAALTSSTPVEITPAKPAPPVAASPAEPGSLAREPTPARVTELRLELSNDSWVEIYDSRGERLYYDVASAGSVQSVSGRGPLRVVLGNAAGVSVHVDGQARDIPANAADGEGARFVVNRSGSLSRAR